jgi:hypothetical protein
MTLQDKLNKSINNTFQKSISIICKICESEIEKIFLLKIIDYVLKRHHSYSLSFIYTGEDELELLNGIETTSERVNYIYDGGFGRLNGIRIHNINNTFYIDIIPQKEIEFHGWNSINDKIKYRLDFGVYKYSTNNSDEVLKKYCIECDGYDFHSSKVQIKKDNTRMLDLLLRDDYNTIRYLGTTIFNMDENEIGKLLFKLTW